MKTITFFRRILPAIILIAAGFAAGAQDIHFSQFSNAPIILNPGLAGVFGGDLRFVANYRDQWRSVPVPFTTLSATVENKIYHERAKYDRYFTVGALLNYDRQGTLKLTTMQVGIPLSYTAPLARSHYLTLGVIPAFGQRAFSTEKLTTDAQWQESFFDPLASTREDQLFANTNLKYFDLSAGLNYRYQSVDSRAKMDIGAGIHHLNQPKHNFWEGDENIQLNARLALYVMGVLPVTETADLVLHGIYQRQGGYEQGLFGVAGRFHLVKKSYEEFALQVGIDYRARYRDALIPHLEAHWRTWILGLSWDINRSELEPATRGRGGPEISLLYRLYRVKPMPFKSCPII